MLAVSCFIHEDGELRGLGEIHYCPRFPIFYVKFFSLNFNPTKYFLHIASCKTKLNNAVVCKIRKLYPFKQSKFPIMEDFLHFFFLQTYIT